MSRSPWRLPLLAVLVTGSLAACIPVAVMPSAAPGVGAPAGIGFTASTLQLETGKSTPLAPMLRQGGVVPSATETWQWRVSDPSVAAVGADGTVKGLKPGSAIVTAVSATDPTRQASLSVMVVNNQSTVHIRVTPESVVLQPGEQQQLEAAVHLANGTITSNVHWTSSDNTIAGVNATTGIVTALKLGRVTIRATHALDGTHQVVDVQIVEDKTIARPSAQPSAVVFGESPGAAPTPAPLGRWLKQASGVSENLSSVDFVDAQTGFAMGEKGLLLATADGGATWTQRTPLSLGFQAIARCDFGSAGVGLALTTDGRLYRTADGGDSWEVVAAAEGKTCRDFTVLDASTMVAVWASEVHRSSDQGVTWSPVTVPLGAGETASTVGAFGERFWIGVGNKLYRELSGVGWASEFVPTGGSAGIARVAFRSATFGFAHGANDGGVAVTRDGGATFTAVGANAAATAWTGPSHGWIASPVRQVTGAPLTTRLTATEDGGATWHETPFDSAEPLIRALAFVSREVGWAVGDNGALYRYQPRP